MYSIIICISSMFQVFMTYGMAAASTAHTQTSMFMCTGLSVCLFCCTDSMTIIGAVRKAPDYIQCGLSLYYPLLCHKTPNLYFCEPSKSLGKD